MSRWEKIWEQAVEAAARPDEPPEGIEAVAVDRGHAAALSVSGANDVGRLLLMQLRGETFVSWSEPVIELLSPSRPPSGDSGSPLRWTVGPVKVVERGHAIWAVAGELVQPAAAVGISVGERSATGSVHGRHFAAVNVGASPEIEEIWVCGLAPDRASAVWSVRLTAANEIVELD